MSTLQSVIRILESRGYRLTPSRLAVLAAVLGQKGHFVAEDVLRVCPAVGRATVFRALKDLADMDIVCRVLMDNGNLHYKVSAPGHHHHFVCLACGKVEDIESCIASDLIESEAKKAGYEFEGHWLELYGRCASCRMEKAGLSPGGA